MSGETITRRASGVYIVNKQRNKVLLTQRGPTARNEQGAWEGVGGEVEPKETFIQAGIREVREEIGVHVVLLSTLSEHKSITDANGIHWHTKRFIANISDGEPTIAEPGKIQDIGWFEAGQLDELNIASYLRSDVPLLQQYLSVEPVKG